ncbi:hypothetical protein HYPBUDRAFT_113043 [Hyphopichia burtonii NRRL Y-1933]|uniref:t-SNARE coiled-coil homology domain-containing protein n=1 Tax=Hyphopichia burtonii NRRL Y-1933 TaxID=984485 RepID=A0A1E4REM0_9ASCO|nr:hypothetical protein HYPBUDRAFT_113043 [Hyphopichia burtonii NRRL Y-1933]ODV65691.1 hypothetical protein HYPBUDRAFT_113043 [Hyphopichia burtonii NRRL Y-1933]
MSNLYSHREQQNNQRFDQLAQTLHQFRTVVNDDIHGSIQQENLTLDMLNDNFGQVWIKVKRTSGDLRNVMNRNASLTRIIGLILLIFVIIWMLTKLR